MISNPIPLSLVKKVHWDVDSLKKKVFYQTAGGNET